MKVVVSGGTGFIGVPLVRALADAGHEPVVLTRNPRRASAWLDPRARVVAWDARTLGGWERELSGADAVVNLAGESIGEGRWTPERKERIMSSRVAATRAIVAGLQQADPRPRVLVNASAVGYYGPRGDEVVTEADGPGSDFLAQVVIAWEAAAREAEPLGVRVVRQRMGIVLGQGGALGRMLLPFRLGLGGPIGSGRQWYSWIHRDDAIGLILFALTREDASGAINATAPNPVRMKEFAATLGKVLRRPALLPVPALALRLLLGEQAEAVLSGQRVLPTVAERLGYRFRFPDLETALRDVLGVPGPRQAGAAAGPG